jgi:hypothetical protein
MKSSKASQAKYFVPGCGSSYFFFEDMCEHGAAPLLMTRRSRVFRERGTAISLLGSFRLCAEKALSVVPSFFFAAGFFALSKPPSLRNHDGPLFR